MEFDIVRAWKDTEYRSTLSAEQLALAGNPVSAVEAISAAAGGDGLVARYSTDYCYGCRSRISRYRTRGLCCC